MIKMNRYIIIAAVKSATENQQPEITIWDRITIEYLEGLKPVFEEIAAKKSVTLYNAHAYIFENISGGVQLLKNEYISFTEEVTPEINLEYIVAERDLARTNEEWRATINFIN